MDFNLKEDSEFIELVRLLKIMNLVGSGGEAKHLIKDGKVTVNGEIETRKKAKIRKGDEIQFNDQTIFIN